jgi:hypothetical protein
VAPALGDPGKLWGCTVISGFFRVAKGTSEIFASAPDSLRSIEKEKPPRRRLFLWQTCGAGQRIPTPRLVSWFQNSLVLGTSTGLVMTMSLTERGLCASIFLPLRSCFTAFRFLVLAIVSSLTVGFELAGAVLLTGDYAHRLPMCKDGSECRTPLILGELAPSAGRSSQR